MRAAAAHGNGDDAQALSPLTLADVAPWRMQEHSDGVVALLPPPRRADRAARVLRHVGRPAAMNALSVRASASAAAAAGGSRPARDRNARSITVSPSRVAGLGCASGVGENIPNGRFARVKSEPPGTGKYVVMDAGAEDDMAGDDNRN